MSSKSNLPGKICMIFKLSETAIDSIELNSQIREPGNSGNLGNPEILEIQAGNPEIQPRELSPTHRQGNPARVLGRA